GRASGEVPAERTLARLARVAPAPAGRVAAGAAVGAARRAQVVERLAPRGVQPVGDGLVGGGVDLLLDRGRQVAGRAAQRIVLTGTAVLARDLDAPEIGEQGVDLLVVHRAATFDAPWRHR